MTGERDGEGQERPSVGDLRRRVLGAGPRLGTGWPIIDAVSGGIPTGRTTVVRAPSELRLQVLARLAAWAAGEGYPTVIASRSRTADELWLAVGAGGLGLPPTALLTTHAHDAWVDDRLRVLDVRVLGGPDAPELTGAELRRRMPSLLILDDFITWDSDWVVALDPAVGRLDLQQWPRTAGCALVLGLNGMDDFSDWLDRGIFTLRLAPCDDGSRMTVGAYSGLRKERRTVLLRDGFLDPPPPGASCLRREGVANLWEDRSEQDISAFASALGSEVVSMVWEREDGDPPER